MDLLDLIRLTLLILIPIPTAYGWGRYFISLFETENHPNDAPSLAVCFLSGLGFIAAFLGIYSIFWPINLLAFTPIIITGFWLYLNYGVKIGHKVVVVGAMVLALFIAGIPPQLNDHYLYYLTTLEWINRFPALPGLANFQSRLGFNSNWHLIQAGLRLNSSWPTVLNLSLWLALVMDTLITWKDSDASRFKRWIKGLMPLPVYILFKYLNVPSPDFPVMILTFYLILISWEIIEGRSKALITLWVLALIGIGIKASAIALLAFPIAATLYLKKRDLLKRIVVLAVILLGPFLIRNFILTGYWVYPIPFTGFLKPDWQVPITVLVEETAFVKASGKIPAGYTLASADLGLSEWFPIWIKYQKATHLSLLISALIFSLVLTIKALKQTKYYFLAVPYIAATVFWFLNAPNPRFAYGLLFTAMFAIIALALERFLKPDSKTQNLSVACAGGLALFAFGATAVKVKPLPLDFSTGNYTPAAMGNLTVYEAQKTGLCGISCFPCTNYLQKGVELRGKDINNGLRVKKELLPNE